MSVTDPLPERRFPLPIVLERERFPASELSWRNSLISARARDAYDGLCAVVGGNRRAADARFEAAGTGTSVECTGGGGAEKSVVIYEDEVWGRMRGHGVPHVFYVKKYRDPETVLRVAYLNKAMFHEAERDPSFPLAETLEYTVDHTVFGEDRPRRIISLAYGRDLETELLLRTGMREEALLNAVLAYTHRVIHYLTGAAGAEAVIGSAPAYLVPRERISRLLDGSRREEYSMKFAASSLGVARRGWRRHPLHAAAAVISEEGDRIRGFLQDGPFVPHADTKLANLARERITDAPFDPSVERVRGVDWEKASELIHVAHLLAHPLFDPAFAFPAAARMERLLREVRPYGVDAGGASVALEYYLVRQLDIATRPGRSARDARRAGGFLDSLRWLAASGLLPGGFTLPRRIAALELEHHRRAEEIRE